MRGEGLDLPEISLDSLKCHTSPNPLRGWRRMTIQPKFSNDITRGFFTGVL